MAVRGSTGGFRLVIAGVLLALGIGAVPAVAHAQTDTTYEWGSFSIRSASHEKSPTAIGDLGQVSQIDAANSSDEILAANGDVYTVGTNSYGELGQGDRTNSPDTAVQVSLPWPATATNGAGATYGWGENEFDQLCIGNTTPQTSPVAIASLAGRDITAMAGGGTHILYQTGPDTLLACGTDHYGELGDGSFRDTPTSTPVTVDTSAFGSEAIVAISAGRSTSTALLANGTVWMWGYGKFGQLGDGSTVDKDVPTEVRLPAGQKAAEVYSGGDTTKDGQTLTLLTDGSVYGWGYNANGELGNGTTTNSDLPVQATALPAGDTWVSVATGGENSLALTATGVVYSWGNNQYGQVGNATIGGNVMTPVEVDTNVDIISTTADEVVAHTS
jgi:alpha-tubulin suppressor-like RCC1 family protein